METAIITALIAGSGAIVSAGVGLLRKKESNSAPTPPIELAHNPSTVLHNVADSNIAVGNNITQTIQGTVHNQVIVTPMPSGPFGAKIESRPKIGEIERAVRSAKPFNKEQIGNSYVGIPVSWPVLFSTAKRRSTPDEEAEVWGLFFDATGFSQSTVWVEVRIDSQPKLRVIDRGHRAWIDGKISSVEEGIGVIVSLATGAEITLE